MTTELPLWAVYSVAFGTPFSALVGVLLTLGLNRKTARELHGRARQEEFLRNVRWAVDLATDDNPRRGKLGIDQLRALSKADSGVEAQALVDAALSSLILLPEGQIRGLEARGLDADPVLIVVDVDDSLKLSDDVRWTLSRGREDGDA